MPFLITKQDITKMNVDVIVHIAVSKGQSIGDGRRTDSSESRANERFSSYEPCVQTCMEGMQIKKGRALPAKYVITLAAPMYVPSKEEQSYILLAKTYFRALQCAYEHKCESIAIPLISNKLGGYPKEGARQVAISQIRSFLADHDVQVFLVVSDKNALLMREDFLGKLNRYIKAHGVMEPKADRPTTADMESVCFYDAAASRSFGPISKSKVHRMEIKAPTAEIDKVINNLDEPFSLMLLRLIDAKGMTDVEVYKRANMDRKLFSKIRTGKEYRPSKRTVIALAVALELSLDETSELLQRAGFALSPSSIFDVIIEFFIMHGKYDFITINEALFSYDQPLLGE